MDGNLTVERNRHRNDVHSGLNPTRHARVFLPDSAEAVAELLLQARSAGQRVAVAGAQHAMGGQQFAQDGWLLDSRHLSGVLDFDSERGWLQVGAGTRWPELQRFLAARRDGSGRGWSIRQKQTGADNFSLGGSLAANIHGRGLDLPPFVGDIENFTLVGADGMARLVDREREPELFALAVGGYGLLGVVTDLTLRLQPRQCLRRRVQLLRSDALATAFEQARGAGACYGDFQFAIDPDSRDFLDLGVFSDYTAVDEGGPKHAAAQALSGDDWRELLWLAHVDKSAAFNRYAAFYQSTDGQHYGSDDQQFGIYLDGYHNEIDYKLGHRGSEVITELYVPPERIGDFLAALAEDCRRHAVDLIYGTVRQIRADRETLLAWAPEDRACVVLNLHVRHDQAGINKAAEDLQRLIDVALRFGGSFYLTYHRFARPDQLRAAYPGLPAFLAAKTRYDPADVLVSDWLRQLRRGLQPR